MELTTIIDNQPNAKDIDILQRGLNDFNADQLKERPHEFAIYLKDDLDEIRGGITALAFSDSIHIALLWVCLGTQEYFFVSHYNNITISNKICRGKFRINLILCDCY